MRQYECDKKYFFKVVERSKTTLYFYENHSKKVNFYKRHLTTFSKIWLDGVYEVCFQYPRFFGSRSARSSEKLENYDFFKNPGSNKSWRYLKIFWRKNLGNVSNLENRERVCAPFAPRPVRGCYSFVSRVRWTAALEAKRCWMFCGDTVRVGRMMRGR